MTQTVQPGSPRSETKMIEALRVIAEVLREPNRDAALVKLLEHAIRLIGGSRGFIVGIEDNRFVERASLEFGDDGVSPTELEMSTTIAWRAIREGRIVECGDARAEYPDSQSVQTSKMMRSVVVAPLLVDGEPRGALIVDNPRERAFDPRDIEVFGIMTSIVGIGFGAIERAVAAEKRAAAALGLIEAELVGDSEAIKKVRSRIETAATCDLPILIRGESGTGKELVARAIQRSRGEGPFVVRNSSAFTDTLVESELFGHEAGSFTGANADSLGAFQRAQGGTLFLDEVGDGSLAFQKALLRALQEGEVRPVGGETRKVDVRVIAATNADLEELMETKQFRKDLFYRLNPFTIEIPPLRERREDILPIAVSLLAKHAARRGAPVPSLTRAAIETLERHTWPGNVRELEGMLQVAVIMGLTQIDTKDLTFARPEPAEAREIRDALKQTNGNKSAAAKVLGISRNTLYSKMAQHGIPLKKGEM